MLIVVHYCYRFLCTVVTDSCALLLPFFVHSPYHFLCTRDFCLHLFCGDDDAAQRAAVVYSLLATCKARGVDERAWLEDVLRRMPEYELGKKDFSDLLPGKWSPTAR